MRIFIFIIRPGVKEIQDEWEQSTRFTLCEPSQRILTGMSVIAKGKSYLYEMPKQMAKVIQLHC